MYRNLVIASSIVSIGALMLGRPGRADVQTGRWPAASGRAQALSSDPHVPSTAPIRGRPESSIILATLPKLGSISAISLAARSSGR